MNVTRLASWLWLLVAVTPCSAQAPQTEEARPNIILLLTDDQRADFLGCAGHPTLLTPNVDALAAGGVRFSNAFVTTPICAASRASILTGTFESRHGYTFGTDPVSREVMEASYPAVLKRAGYSTGFIGKYGIRTAVNTGELFDVFRSVTQPFVRRRPDGTTRHTTDIIGDHALAFLRSQDRSQPFCLSVSFAAPHAVDGERSKPYPYPDDEADLYSEGTVAPPKVSTDAWRALPEFLRDSMHRDRWQWRWSTPADYQKHTKSYYRMISGIDRVVGSIVRESRRLGFANNTVVIFTSDNGYYKGSRGFAGKWSHFDESLHVPLVIHDPRTPASRRGLVLSEIALNIDLASTICDLAGQPREDQGRSVVPLLRRNVSEWRNDFFCEHRFDHARLPQWEGIRGERWVYARYVDHLPEGEFLHDLAADPQELINLATDPNHTARLAEMRLRCDQVREASR